MGAENAAHRRISWLVIAVLLFLRIPVLLAGYVLLSGARPDWLPSLFQVATYVLTAFLIWWERDNLAEFHVDILAIAIIVFFKPMQTLLFAWGLSSADSILAFPHWGSLIVWATAIVLVAALWRGRRALPRLRAASFGWFALGAVAGIAAAIALGYPWSFQVDKSNLRSSGHLFAAAALFWRFVSQLGMAAVTEEPLFRGFLWGRLRKMGWREVRVWLFQAGLFTLAHAYYWEKAPISLWLVVPTGAMVFGLLAWRTRTISSSMAAHAAVNTFGDTMGRFFASLRQ